MAKCTGVRCQMQYGYKVDECNHTDCPYRTEPITNADRIRAMSDEELAEYFGRAGFCNTVIPRHYCLNQKICSRECLVRWLQQPAEGE